MYGLIVQAVAAHYCNFSITSGKELSEVSSAGIPYQQRAGVFPVHIKVIINLSWEMAHMGWKVVSESLLNGLEGKEMC